MVRNAATDCRRCHSVVTRGFPGRPVVCSLGPSYRMTAEEISFRESARSPGQDSPGTPHVRQPLGAGPREGVTQSRPLLGQDPRRESGPRRIVPSPGRVQPRTLSHTQFLRQRRWSTPHSPTRHRLNLQKWSGSHSAKLRANPHTLQVAAPYASGSGLDQVGVSGMRRRSIFPALQALPRRHTHNTPERS